MSQPLLDVCHKKWTDNKPIWLMRQAGRYLKEYRDLRANYGFLECCKNPSLAAEISLQPFRRFKPDGVILFSDIMIPAVAMGVELEFNPGPVIAAPIRSQKDVDALQVADPYEKTPYVLETLKILKKEIKNESTLIGFCGAPFTTASYLVEGHHSKDFSIVKKMMKDNPDLLHGLLEKLTQTLIHYMKAQVQAGAEVVQLFDSWAAILSNEEYKVFSLPYKNRIIEALTALAPVILFARGTERHKESIKQTKATVIGIDQGFSLKEAVSYFGQDKVYQGNLDPVVLQSGTKEQIKQETYKILDVMKDCHHIFNLGHGVLKETPVENVQYLIELVKNHHAA